MRVMTKPPATAVSKYNNLAFVPVLERRLFFAVLLPFTCDFAIYSPCFKTARYGAVFGGLGVRIYPK